MRNQPTKRMVYVVAQMVKDDMHGDNSYFLNEIVAVFGNEASANTEAEKLAAIGGTYSVFEHEVRHSILM